MVTKYIKFKAHKRGIPKQDGSLRTCMHCNKQAIVSAVCKGVLVMDVWFCKEHSEYAKSFK